MEEAVVVGVFGCGDGFGVGLEPSEAKVDDFDFGAVGRVREENVLGLEVAVDDALAVDVLNGADEGLHEEAGLALGEVDSLADAVEELAAVEVLHDDVGVEVVLEDVEELDDVLVALAFA